MEKNKEREYMENIVELMLKEGIIEDYEAELLFSRSESMVY